MKEFKFDFGQLVHLDPTGREKGAIGKVTGQTRFIDGSLGYVVALASYNQEGITRHSIAEDEISAVKL